MTLLEDRADDDARLGRGRDAAEPRVVGGAAGRAGVGVLRRAGLAHHRVLLRKSGAMRGAARVFDDLTHAFRDVGHGRVPDDIAVDAGAGATTESP
jgi:hypothetical protein